MIFKPEELGLPTQEEAKFECLSDAGFVFQSEYSVFGFRLDDQVFAVVANGFSERWQRGVIDHLEQAYSASAAEAAAIPLDELVEWYDHRLGLLHAYEISLAGNWLSGLLEQIAEKKASE